MQESEFQFLTMMMLEVADKANDSLSLTCKFAQTLIMPQSPKFELLLIQHAIHIPQFARDVLRTVQQH